MSCIVLRAEFQAVSTILGELLSTQGVSVAGKILQTVQVQYALVSRPSFLREELTTLH